MLFSSQALQNHEPDQWASLPNLQQKRQAYYSALEASNRSLIGAQQVGISFSWFAQFSVSV